ncbi:MAG: diphthine--ammonia ligase [Nitrosopumilaceae archaeon]|uniref:Diphthine--ammonia ligase n=2 Tax=Candidatus Nitrosomaritimum aestuariumsis TaxID=3342354 RepID=A0AC60W833_9ARCH|nr:diphthine--ammonia ligase [Nitrosopumilaceae archaeon]MBA4463405.1 diphthine--ammonia ligase [Nitrosopumilaceae archaeon]
MKLAALFSGGKDSAYAIYLAKKQGHNVKCLVSILPKSEESHLLHHPNLKWTKLQSELMEIPQITLESDSDDTANELDLIKTILIKAKKDYDVEGLVHGGIKSKFQKNKFQSICDELNLKSISPLWDAEPKKYMNDLISSNFDFIITSVSSDGLDDSWLGKTIGKKEIEKLEGLSEKFEFNLNFEGGEAETFVTRCPLFSGKIEIVKGEKNWDGYRGRFEIVDARLNYDA